MPQQIKRFYEFGAFRVDAANRDLLKEGKPLPLTPKVFDTLLVLVERRGQVVEKDELMKLLWPDSFVEEANLTQNVSILRKLLGESPNDHRYIVTVPGRGYRFVAEVTESGDEETDLIVKERTRSRIVITQDGMLGPSAEGIGDAIEQSNEADSLSQLTTKALPSERPGITLEKPLAEVHGWAFPKDNERTVGFLRRPVRRLLFVVLVVAIVTLGSLGLYLLSRRDKTLDRAIDSVVVLPFTNTSGNPDTEYVSDGISESLINSLSQLSKLRVIARTTAFRYKGSHIDVQKVGRDLGVRAVVTGKVDQRGDVLSIQADLIETARGSQLWGAKHNLKLSDIFTVQEEVARQISEQLRFRLTSEEEKRLTKRYTENVEAYELYLKGRYSWNRRTGETLKTAIEYFEKAIQRDPGFALAYSAMAECYAVVPSYADVPPRESYPKARAAALKALELDDTLAEAHTALALVKFAYDWDWDGAEREYQRALELNPRYPTACQWYAEFLASHKRFNEALASAKRAQQLDPLSPIIGTVVGSIFYVSRRYDEAIEQYRQTLAMDPNFGYAHWTLGNVYSLKAMHSEAIAEFQAAMTLRGYRLADMAHLGYGYAVSGNRGEALKIHDELMIRSKSGYVPPFPIVRLYVGLGDKDRAFKWLSRALEDRTEPLVNWVAVDPMFDPLRSDPRFSEALRRMNLNP